MYCLRENYPLSSVVHGAFQPFGVIGELSADDVAGMENMKFDRMMIDID